MEYSTLVEIVAATHLSRYVQSPFENRGGLMLVAPPGAFKTSITETMDEFSSTQIISDMNVQSLVRMKDHFLSGQITTLAFSDFGKLYKRHSSVASNVEGIIMALADEGFRKPSWANQSGGSIPARCTIIAGMTTSFFDDHHAQWERDGFLRRFLFAKYIIDGMEIVEDAVAQWRKAQFDGNFQPKSPVGRTIVHTLNKKEIELITYTVRHQPSRSAASIMMQKIYCVLKWKFSETKAESLIEDFAPALGKEGATMILRDKLAKQNKLPLSQ